MFCDIPVVSAPRKTESIFHRNGRFRGGGGVIPERVRRTRGVCVGAVMEMVAPLSRRQGKMAGISFTEATEA